ncbi:hypothetical protein [Fibrella aestuarina]|uniref:hypothetical protein n=1 Tax=Fibrella aestuarina TaxID=651143 RepID=UPI00059E88BF|nr:hypothetical protein [Fibrella aestuarina]
MSKQRFYIPTRGNDDEAYKEALKFACELANSDSELTKVILLIPSKGNTGWFDRLFGPAIVKELFKGKIFKNCIPIFKFETIKTYKDNFKAGDIVITCGLYEEDIFKIDDYYCVKAIIAIPWLPEKVQKWIQTWNPIDIRTETSTLDQVQEPSCIVKKALEELTDYVNMGTGIVHPDDNERAKTIIMALHKYEPALDSNLVGAYLVRELNWDNRHAQDVEKLIITLNNGKHFKGGQRTGLQNYYKDWKNQCNQ